MKREPRQRRDLLRPVLDDALQELGARGDSCLSSLAKRLIKGCPDRSAEDLIQEALSRLAGNCGAYVRAAAKQVHRAARRGQALAVERAREKLRSRLRQRAQFLLREIAEGWRESAKKSDERDEGLRVEIARRTPPEVDAFYAQEVALYLRFGRAITNIRRAARVLLIVRIPGEEPRAIRFEFRREPALCSLPVSRDDGVYGDGEVFDPLPLHVVRSGVEFTDESAEAAVWEALDQVGDSPRAREWLALKARSADGPFKLERASLIRVRRAIAELPPDSLRSSPANWSIERFLADPSVTMLVYLDFQSRWFVTDYLRRLPKDPWLRGVREENLKRLRPHQPEHLASGYPCRCAMLTDILIALRVGEVESQV